MHERTPPTEYPPNQVPLAQEYKYLGVLLTTSLQWGPHVNNNVLPSLRMSSHRLTSALANTDTLSPTTCINVLRTYMLPLMQYGAAIWAHTTHSESSRFPRPARQAIDKPIHIVLRSILGVNPTTSHRACARELGWLGTDHAYALAKLSLAHRILKQPVSSLLRAALLHKMDENCY